MSPAPQREADARLVAALERRALRDPRDALRARLRALRETPAFQQQVRYYEEVLVPGVASGEAEPVEAWESFGRRIAQAGGAGREVAVDPGGRAGSPGPDVADDSILLYIPDDPADPALPLRVPASPSAAQEATLALLVEGKLRL